MRLRCPGMAGTCCEVHAPGPGWWSNPVGVPHENWEEAECSCGDQPPNCVVHFHKVVYIPGPANPVHKIMSRRGKCVACEVAGEQGDGNCSDVVESVAAGIGLALSSAAQSTVTPGDSTLTDMGTSECIVATGKVAITNNDQTCTRICTGAHELVHAADEAEVCARYYKCYHKPGSTPDDKKKCHDAYQKWLTDSSGYLECRAYVASSGCLAALAALACASPRCRTCCQRASQALASDLKNVGKYCASTPKTAAVYPFDEDGNLVEP